MIRTFEHCSPTALSAFGALNGCVAFGSRGGALSGRVALGSRGGTLSACGAVGRWLAACLLVVSVTSLSSADESSRASHFERAATALDRRGDREGAALLRELGRQAPIVPFALSETAVTSHSVEAGRYRISREKVRRAILSGTTAGRDDDRVIRAEADLHLVAYELEKRDLARMGNVRRFLDDAAWQLRGLEFAEPNEAEATARQMSALRETSVLVPLARLLRSDTRALPPRVSLAAVPESVKPGAAVMLQWRAANAETVLLDGRLVTPQGATLVTPPETRRYELTAQGPGGRAHTSILVTVLPHAAPRAALVATPPRIRQGENVYILWRASDAETVTLNGLRVPLQGTAIEAPSTSVSYRLEAVGPGGRAEASASVLVETRSLPAPAASAGHAAQRSDRYISWFTFTGSRPDSATRESLDRFAALMRADSTRRLLVLGHTDGAGTESANLRLSVRRALQARDWIARRYRLSRDQFEVEGRGEREPLVPEARSGGTASAAARHMNRRIELILR
jgi:outer membrane protein OmpA-like peptidoglycan-associated protein